MEIRIGIMGAAREISIETALSEKEVSTMVSEAVSSNAPVIVFSNEKGGSVLVPTSSLGYVEFTKTEERRVGFIA